MKGPVTPKDYRPVSLCNVRYKVVTKILVNRLKRALPLLISPEQSAFVQGRVITDNVLLAKQVLHSMGSRRERRSLMALKLDMERAYDEMRWAFIAAVMNKFGFAKKFIDLVWSL